MKQELSPPRLGEPGHYVQVYRDGERVLLTVRADWPRLEETSPGLRRINRYYDRLVQKLRERWEGELLARAKAEATPDTPPWEAVLSFTVSLLTPELLSLTWTAAEDLGGERPSRMMEGDTWSLPDGLPLPLSHFLLPHCQKKALLKELSTQIQARSATGESLFYEDWPLRINTYFSPRRFFLTPEGPILFFPMKTIAPAMEGFPAFSLSALSPQAPQTDASEKEQQASS